VKRIAGTLGVARSNLIERAAGRRPKRGPQTRAGDVELTADIRRLVDTRRSYGYRRIAPLLKRERRAAGLDLVNAKRVYRLMKKNGFPKSDLIVARAKFRDGPLADSCSAASFDLVRAHKLPHHWTTVTLCITAKLAA
jgi:transposase InsO family protein